MQSQVLKSLPPETLNQRILAHHPTTGTVPTLTVKLKSGDGVTAIINAGDFDAEKHEVVDQEAADTEKLESLGEGTEDDPAEEYRVYKSFTYDGLFFEKNGAVKLKKSVAHELSKRFHCLWPVSQEEEVNQNSVLRDQLVRGLGGEVEERDPANQNTTGA